MARARVRVLVEGCPRAARVPMHARSPQTPSLASNTRSPRSLGLLRDTGFLRHGRVRGARRPLRTECASAAVRISTCCRDSTGGRWLRCQGTQSKIQVAPIDLSKCAPAVNPSHERNGLACRALQLYCNSSSSCKSRNRRLCGQGKIRRSNLSLSNLSLVWAWSSA